MAAPGRTFQSPEPTDDEYVNGRPAGEEERFVYFGKWVLTSYGFLPELFDPNTYRAEGYLDKDMATRLKFFKGKESPVIDTIIAVGVRKNFFDAAARATFEGFANFLEFLRTPEGAAAVTEDLRKEKFRAAGKGTFQAIDIASAAQLVVQAADLEQHKARMIEASQKRIEELELRIAKEKEALETRLARSSDEFYPASVWKKMNPMKRQKECWTKAKAADPVLAAVVAPSTEQLMDAIKRFGEDVDRAAAVAFLGQQDRLPRLRQYVNKKILSFRGRGKNRVATRLGHTLAAMGGRPDVEIPAGGPIPGDLDDSDGEDYIPDYEHEVSDESDADDEESDAEDEAPERVFSPLQTRGQRAKRPGNGGSSSSRGARARAKAPRRA